MKAFTGTAAATLILVISCGMGRSKPLSVQTNSVDLHNEDDQINQVGSLIFQGGLNLTSLDPRFGGFFGPTILADGRRFSAVADRGDWVHFGRAFVSTGRLTGIDDAQTGRLKTLPALTRAIPANKGVEAPGRLRDGRLSAIEEIFPKDAPLAQDWIFDKHRWTGFRYWRHAVFLPIGAATFPDGRLLGFKRRFNYIDGFGTRLAMRFCIWFLMTISAPCKRSPA